MTDWDYYGGEDYDERRLAICADCGSDIYWLKTKNNKKIAVEVDEVDEEDEIFDRAKHTCHWDSCLAKKVNEISAKQAFRGI